MCQKITKDITQSQQCTRDNSVIQNSPILVYTVYFFSLPHEVLAVRRVKEIPSFLSYFEALCIGLALGIEPATTRSTVTRSTDWANPASVIPRARMDSESEYCFSPVDPNPRHPALQSSALPTELILPRLFLEPEWALSLSIVLVPRTRTRDIPLYSQALYRLN